MVSMLSILISATLLIAPVQQADPITGHASSSLALAAQERAEGFDWLFARAFPKFRAFRGRTLPARWKAENGTLTLTKRPGRGGDIVTLEEYQDFDFRWDWKVEPGGNSGVYYRSSENFTPGYLTGPEYQLLDNQRHPDGKNPLTSAGSAYALYAPVRDTSRPAGQWNSSRLVIKGNHVEHFLNGLRVVSYDLNSPEWKARYAKSKFATFENYGQMPQGRIVLQDHGDVVSFRNMRIKKL
jgi:hypothetical protein